MAGSYGYKFIFFVIIFYAFLAFVLTLDGGSATKYLSNDIPDFESATTFPSSVNVTIAGFDTGLEVPNIGGYINMFIVILTNPFSGIGFISWLSIAMLITLIYIVITSVIP